MTSLHCSYFYMLYSPSVLRIQKVQRQNASDFYLGKEEWQASINVPSANFAKNGLYWLPSQLSNVLTKCSFGFFSNFHRCLFVNLHSLRDSYCFEINIILFFFFLSMVWKTIFVKFLCWCTPSISFVVFWNSNYHGLSACYIFLLFPV